MNQRLELRYMLETHLNTAQAVAIYLDLFPSVSHLHKRLALERK